MKVLRPMLLFLGLACLVIVASVNHSRTVTTAGEVSDLRIGFEPSPRIRREVRDGAASWRMNVLSGSALFALGAAGCFWLYARLGRASVAPEQRKTAAEVDGESDTGRKMC